mgnify:CR=1 FL=1
MKFPPPGPTAWLAGRWKGVDLRSQGSGNLGATNVMRVLGPGIGALVFSIDIAKGSLPVLLLAPRIDAPAEMRAVWAIACGLAAIVGHIRPVFLGFGKGGKGVATACGVFLALAPIHTGLTLLIFVAVVLASEKRARALGGSPLGFGRGQARGRGRRAGPARRWPPTPP